MLLAGLVVLVGQTAWAQRAPVTRGPRTSIPAAELPDITKTDWTLEKLDHPAQREVKFERSDSDFAKRLTRPDPKLLEQKYVAIIRLSHPEVESSLGGGNRGVVEFGRSSLRLDDDISSHQFLAGRMLLTGELRLNDITYRDSFSRFLKQIPDDRLPAVEQLAFFTSEEVDRGYILFVQHAREEMSLPSEIHILAPTPEIAEDRAKALLQILDQGSFRPIQTALFKQREEHAAEWSRTRQQASEVESQLKELRTKLADYADFTSDMLTGMRLQQLQLDVELSGAQARLEACQKLLNDLSPRADSRAKLEESKIVAEIEVAGIKASQAKASELVKTMKAKNEMTNQETGLQTRRADLRTQLDRSAQSIALLDSAIKQNAPMPLVDGKVLIQPIKWTQ